jgi:hypothetical protein
VPSPRGIPRRWRERDHEHTVAAGASDEEHVDVIASGHRIGITTKAEGEFRLNNVPDGEHSQHAAHTSVDV